MIKMTKRRTKKQKIKAKSRQEVVNYTFKAEKEEEIKKTGKKKLTIRVEEKAETKLIIGDLIKTGLISLVLLALLIGTYYYLNK